MKPITVKTEKEFIKDYGVNWDTVDFFGNDALNKFKTKVSKRLVGKIIELQDPQYHDFVKTGILRMDYDEYVTTDMINWEVSKTMEFFDDTKNVKGDKDDIYKSRMINRPKLNTTYPVIKSSIYTDRLKSYKV